MKRVLAVALKLANPTLILHALDWLTTPRWSWRRIVRQIETFRQNRSTAVRRWLLWPVTALVRVLARALWRVADGHLWINLLLAFLAIFPTGEFTRAWSAAAMGEIRRATSTSPTPKKSYAFALQDPKHRLKIASVVPAATPLITHVPVLTDADAEPVTLYPPDAVVREVARYEVQTADHHTPIITTISQIDEGHRVLLRLDVAAEIEPAQYRLISWQDNNVRSPNLLVAQPHGLLGQWMLGVETHATTAGFIAFLNEKFTAINNRSAYFKKTYKFTPEVLADCVASPLRSRLTEDCQPMVFNRGVFAQILLGDVIQFATIWLFVYGCIVLAAWLVVNVGWEVLSAWLIARKLRRHSLNERELEKVSQQWLHWCDRLPRVQRAALAKLRGTGQTEQSLPPASGAMWIVELTMTAIVLSGFIGTLVWLAISMLGSADMIAPATCQRIAALSTFSILMAGAFTTTLVASCLEFPLAMAKKAVTSLEHRSLAWAHSQLEAIKDME